MADPTAQDPRLQQLQDITTAYDNASAAKSPDAEPLAQMARTLAQEIQSKPFTPPAPAAPTGARGVADAMAAPADAAASVASGAVAAPASGLAGLLYASGQGMSAAEDPEHAEDAYHGPSAADVINKTQQGMTYQPRTYGGQQITGAVSDVAGLIPKGADWTGQKTLDATGSPLAATAVNTGLQGLAMLAGAKAGPIMGAVREAPIIKPVGNFVSDMLPGGAARGAERLLREYAGTPDAQATAAAQLDLHKAGASGALAKKYGIQPSTAGVTDNTGLATLERTLRNQPGDAATALAENDKANRAKINDILGGISGTPEERLRATTARDFKARTAYEEALNNPENFVQPPGPEAASFEDVMNQKQGVKQPGDNAPAAPVTDTTTGLSPVGQRLQEVLQRPAMEAAMKNARMQAANRGVALDDRNLMQQLHYAKMDLDGQISVAARSGDSTTMGGLMDTKHTLLGVMDDLSPAYAEARKSFQTLSGPLNRMDIGEALKNRYMSALQEQAQLGSTPTSFMNALRTENGDTLAQGATGFNGATLAGSLHPEDLAGLQAIKEQLGREYGAQTRGRSVGSPTAQNLANERSLTNIGSLRGVSGDLGHAGNIALALHHPAIAIADAIRGQAVRRGVNQKLGTLMTNPEAAADILRTQPPAALPQALTAPAAVGANTEGRNDMADGGQPKFTKPTTWDLLKTGWKELTSSDDEPAAEPPNTSGTVASGSKGADFDKWVNRNVDAMSQ